MKYGNESYRLTVLFKDGRSASLKSRIGFDRSYNMQFVDYQDQKIYPPATNYLLHVRGQDTIWGLPTTDGWLFRIVDGEISCYAYWPERSNSKIENNLTTHRILLSQNDSDLVACSKR